MKKKLGFLALISALVLPLSINAQEITKDTTLTKEVTDGILVKKGTTATLNLGGQKVSNTSGDTIKVEKGATLTITGNGDVTNKIDNKAVVLNEGTLVIKGGNYTRVETPSITYYVFLNHGTATIDGGTFEINSKDVSDPSSLISNGWYTPSENTSKEMSNLTINDGIFKMTNNNKYIKNDDYGIMTVNGGTYTMNMPSVAIISNQGFDTGKETLTVNNGEFNYTGSGYAVRDYDWHAADSKYTDNSKTYVNGGIYNLTNENAKITNIKLDNNTKEYSVIGSDEKIIVKEEELKNIIDVLELDEKDLTEDEMKLINNTLADKYTVAGFYNIDLFKGLNSQIKLEQIGESENKIKVTVSLPNTIKKPADGYKRAYYVIRIHEGEAEILNATLNDDGTVSFESDKFSIYAVTYVDTKEEAKTEVKNPNTADNISLFAVIAGASLAGALVSLKSLKKRKNNA